MLDRFLVRGTISRPLYILRAPALVPLVIPGGSVAEPMIPGWPTGSSDMATEPEGPDGKRRWTSQGVVDRGTGQRGLRRFKARSVFADGGEK